MVVYWIISIELRVGIILGIKVYCLGGIIRNKLRIFGDKAKTINIEIIRINIEIIKIDI